MTASSSNCSLTAALPSMLVWKPNFSGKIENNFHRNPNYHDLIIKQLNLYVFESVSWKTSSNWFFQRNEGFKRERSQTSEHCFIGFCLSRNLKCPHNKYPLINPFFLAKSIKGKLQWTVDKIDTIGTINKGVGLLLPWIVLCTNASVLADVF